MDEQLLCCATQNQTIALIPHYTIVIPFLGGANIVLKNKTRTN